MPLRLTVRRLAIAYYDVTARTEMFIRNCDPVAYQRSGSDFAGQQHSNERLGEQHVRAADYDFEAIESAESDMRGVNRGQALQYLFKSITPATGPPSAIHLAVLKFLHKVSVSTGLQPMHRDGSLVTDPLMLLSQSEMACGQVNGLGVDLMAAGGFRGRKVQVGRHVLAEIQYEDSWHYLDGLIFGNGDCVRSPKGGIPSIEELSRTPFTIDALPAYLEGPSLQMNPQIYPSWLYFSRQAYGDTVSAVYVKEDTLESPWLRSYGWDTVKTIPDTSRTLGDFQCLHIPGSVLFQDVKVKHRREDRVSVLLEWGVAVDPDGDLQGYRVYVSKLSRNWHKNIAEDRLGPSPFHSLQTYWRPEMYECLFQEPPHDLGLFVTAIPRIELELPIGRTSYVTVMPFDAHGESVGKRIYQPSEELCFTPDTLRSLSHASLGASSVPSSHGRSAAWAAAILACLALGIWLHVKRLRQRRAREGK
jgi:hypothetical protein